MLLCYPSFSSAFSVGEASTQSLVSDDLGVESMCGDDDDEEINEQDIGNVDLLKHSRAAESHFQRLTQTWKSWRPHWCTGSALLRPPATSARNPRVSRVQPRTHLNLPRRSQLKQLAAAFPPRRLLRAPAPWTRLPTSRPRAPRPICKSFCR